MTAERIPLRSVVRTVIAQLEVVGPGEAPAIVAPLREYVTPGVNVGKTNMGPDEIVEWYAGQILEIIDDKAWHAVNSLINCLDKFCPEQVGQP